MSRRMARQHRSYTTYGRLGRPTISSNQLRLRPTTPAMMRAIDKTFRSVIVSLKSSVPTTLVSIVPAPDQMAYATPRGITRSTNGKIEKQAA
jgi:hypothetical protein